MKAGKPSTCGSSVGSADGSRKHKAAGEQDCYYCVVGAEQRRAQSRSQNNRRHIRRQIALEREGLKPANTATCAERKGSSTGYQRHYWNLEEPCTECRKAHYTRNREHQLRKKLEISRAIA